MKNIIGLEIANQDIEKESIRISINGLSLPESFPSNIRKYSRLILLNGFSAICKPPAIIGIDHLTNYINVSPHSPSCWVDCVHLGSAIFLDEII